ncbi:MAG TPA: biopolymer transporter ExbD [Methylocystis sp.]|nr:biopolymer transporter ExbD [Methylocystis sp.]
MPLASQPKEDDLDAIQYINPAPFVGVVLLVLILALIFRPIVGEGGNGDRLAEAGAPTDAAASARLRLAADRSLRLDERAARIETIGEDIDKAVGGRKDTRLLIEVDRSVPYGELARLLDELRAAGYRSFALVDPELSWPSAEQSPAHSP